MPQIYWSDSTTTLSSIHSFNIYLWCLCARHWVSYWGKMHEYASRCSPQDHGLDHLLMPVGSGRQEEGRKVAGMSRVHLRKSGEEVIDSNLKEMTSLDRFSAQDQHNKVSVSERLAYKVARESCLERHEPARTRKD